MAATYIMETNLVGGINISPEKCTIVLIDASQKRVHQTQVSPHYDMIKKALQPYSTRIRGLAVCGTNAHSGVAEYLMDSGYRTYLICRSRFSQQSNSGEKWASHAADLLREKLVSLTDNLKHKKVNLPKLLGKSVLSDLNKLPITTFLTRL